MADTKKIIINVEVKEVGSKQVSQAASKAAVDLTRMSKADEKAAISAEMLRQKNALAQAAIRQKAAAALAADKSLNSLKATSGLNNAILLETSRLASDASYGFQGISNNLGQLISLFQISAANAGGFGATIRELGKSIMGTGGVLIAVQLLISFLPKIERFFNKTSNEAKKTREEMEKLTHSINEQITSIKTLASSTLNFNVTGKALQENVSILSNRFSEFATGIKKLRKEQNLNEETQDSLIKSFLRLNQVRKEIIPLEKEATDAAKKGIAANEIRKEGERTLQGIIRDKYLELIELEKLFTLEEEKGAKKKERRNAAFRVSDLDFEVERQRSRQRILDSLVKDEQFQVDIQMQGMKDRARIKQQEFVEDQTRRFEQFKSRGVTNEQLKEAQAALNKEIRNSEDELGSYLIQLDKETARKKGDIRLQQNTIIQDRLRKQRFTEQALQQKEDDKEVLNKGIKAGNLLAIQETQLEEEGNRIRMQLDAGNLTFQQREKLENDLTRVTNKQTELRIADAEREAMSKRQLTEQVGNALSAFSDLAGKETKAGKALAISSTLVSTYSAAQKAFESQFLPIPTADSPIRGALAAAAAVASGLANVKSIISESKVATNNKTAMNVEAPDFNVVGASPESQLAASISQQVTQPIKAFVVAKDMTNQQELDRNITTTAGL